MKMENAEYRSTQMQIQSVTYRLRFVLQCHKVLHKVTRNDE